MASLFWDYTTYVETGTYVIQLHTKYSTVLAEFSSKKDWSKVQKKLIPILTGFQPNITSKKITVIFISIWNQEVHNSKAICSRKYILCTFI